MALQTNLIGAGIPALPATILGYPVVGAITAAGTTATDATAMKKAQRLVNLTATGADGIKLPSDANLNEWYIVNNSSGSTGKVYPPTSGTLNGGTATSGALSLTTLKVAMFMRVSSTAWLYILTA